MTLRKRFWVETALAAVTTFLFVLTFITKDWIETVFHIDPDANSGSFEWMLVSVCITATVVFGALAGYELGRARTRATA